MPGILFFVAKLFFFLSWGIQGALIIYLISKVCTQQSNWIGNAENLYVSQNKLRKVGYLIFAFLILISVKNFEVGNEPCFLSLSRWYKSNAIIGIITFCSYIIIKVLCYIYKTEKYYESSIKSFTNSKMFKTILSIIVCFLMSKIVHI